MRPGVFLKELRSFGFVQWAVFKDRPNVLLGDCFPPVFFRSVKSLPIEFRHRLKQSVAQFPCRAVAKRTSTRAISKNRSAGLGRSLCQASQGFG